MRAQPLVQPAVRALDQQVVVERARAPGRRCTGPISSQVAPALAARSTIAGRGRSAGQRRLEEPGRVARRQRAPAPAGVSTSARSAPGSRARSTAPARVSCGPSTANGSPWRASSRAAISSLAGAARWPCCALAQADVHRNVPDVVGIFADRPVGREPAHAGSVQRADPPPGRRGRATARATARLRCGIGLEIGADHEMVMVAQPADELAIAVAVVAARTARIPSAPAPRPAAARRRSPARRTRPRGAAPPPPRRSGRR